LNGAPGSNGKDGAPGLNGAPGSSGNKGDKGDPGSNGRGHRVDRVVSTTCPNGGFTLLFYDIAADGTSTLVDTKDICHGNPGTNGTNGNKGDNGKDGAPGLNGTPGSNGRDGAPGLNGAPGFNGPQGPKGDQGPPGYAYGWHKRFNSAAITGTSTTVLSQVGTGTAAYLIDAKMGAPFANNAKTVTCTLVAVENGVSTTLDSSDTLLLGNSQTTVKHDVSLAGVYTATGGPSANVTFNLNCSTGGDARTLSNGRMNIVGVNSLTQ
jgi:Collagen triple helix repeat (20 copies)